MKKATKQSTLVFLCNACSILCVVVVGVLFLTNMRISTQIAQANQDQIDLVQNANRFMNGSAYLTNEVRAYAATKTQAHYDNYWNEINNLKNRDIGLATMQAIGLTAEEQAVIDEMSAISNTLVPLEDQSMKRTKYGERDEALGYVYGVEYQTEIAKINTLKTQFTEMLIGRTGGEIARLTGLQNILQAVNFAAIALVVLMQVASYFAVTQLVIRPLVKVRDEMRELAQGNLASEFTLTPDTSEMGMVVDAILRTKLELQKYISDISDKLAQMASGNFSLTVDTVYIGDFAPIKTAIETILQALNEAMHEIEQTADQVSSGSEQVSAGAQALSQGATQQASAVEQLSATVTELSAHVKQNAENAQTARAQSEGARKEVSSSDSRMRQMMAAMDEISGKSKQIGKIIKTIEDIAFQTNILALNAAVEAARAGAAGKGFAVVADEVRNLAGKSAEAAKNTTVLIEDTVKAVENGTAIAAGTAEAMQHVVVGSDAVTSLIGKIATASGGQANALSQVAMGVDQISSVVQTNSATAEESAASAEELSGQAQRMQHLVSKFQLRPIQ